MFSYVDNVAEYFLSSNFTKHFSFDREYKNFCWSSSRFKYTDGN